MRTLFTALFLASLVATGACTQPSDVATIEAVDNAAGELDEAFEAQNSEAIKSLVTADHLAVTYYYRTPQTVDEQLASLPDLKYEQTNLTQPTVTMLADDVAMRTFTAKLDGSFKGESLSGTVFVTSIMVNRDGKWLERFYQVTALEP